MKPTAHEILADMIRKNPAVQLLVDTFNLEICEDGEHIRSPSFGGHQ
jgi:hypothetical protein